MNHKSSWPLLLLVFGFGLTTASQDSTVLRNTYNQLTGWNRNLQKDTAMEKEAQSLGCVRTHADHLGSKQDDRAAMGKRKIAYIIACSPYGCTEDATNWSREKPAQIWKEYKDVTRHYSHIINNNRVGCSAEKEGRTFCVFCYLATKANWDPSSATNDTLQIDIVSWDNNSAGRNSLTVTFMSIWLGLLVFFGVI